MSESTQAPRLPWPVHSTDCHVVEPPDLWTARIDKRFRDRAPRVATYEETDLWVVDDNKRMAVVGIQAQAGARFQGEGEGITKHAFYDDIPELTPSRFLSDMDKDGVGVSVIFGSNAHQAYRVVSGPLLSAIFRAFNDWILDWSSEGKGRLRPVTVLNIDDIDEGIAEMKRTVRLGASAVMIPILPLPGRRYDQPQYDVLWAAAADLGVPIIFHVGANQAVIGREPIIDLVRHGMKDLHVRASIATLILSGVFARHPTLRVGVVEFEASWAPYLMEQMDRVYTSGRARSSVRLPDGELPSDHHRRNIFINFQEDAACVRLRHAIGVENLCWGSDYPHAEATFPRSQEILKEQLVGVPPEEAQLIVGGNAARIFGFG
jgi:predicted TIM-barrel fold metal-dependent hydrolase